MAVLRFGSRAYRCYAIIFCGNLQIWILGLTALMLTPMLEGGYYWDDAVNATVYGAERFDAAPLWLNLSVFIQKYFALGRVNVLSVYYYFFFLLRKCRHRDRARRPAGQGYHCHSCGRGPLEHRHRRPPGFRAELPPRSGESGDCETRVHDRQTEFTGE